MKDRMDIHTWDTLIFVDINSSTYKEPHEYWWTFVNIHIHGYA